MFLALVGFFMIATVYVLLFWMVIYALDLTDFIFHGGNHSKDNKKQKKQHKIFRNKTGFKQQKKRKRGNFFEQETAQIDVQEVSQAAARDKEERGKGSKLARNRILEEMEREQRNLFGK